MIMSFCGFIHSKRDDSRILKFGLLIEILSYNVIYVTFFILFSLYTGDGGSPMSEIINNQSERQKKLKALIQRLHQGEDRAAVEMEFRRDFAYVTGAEIAQMEYNLVQEGVSVEEIQSLCDIHASLFQGSVQDMHDDILTVNPLTEFENDNRRFQKLVDASEDFTDDPSSTPKLFIFIQETAKALADVEAHYAKKENILFPMLEKNGITTIPQVMWGVDNKIRDGIRALNEQLKPDTNLADLLITFRNVLTMIKEMIVKENSILFPMLKEHLTNEDLKVVAVSMTEKQTYQAPTAQTASLEGSIPMSAGALSPQDINAIFNVLPFDLTFVGADNRVKFVSQGKDRIFDRPLSVIGRPINLCHPPQSVATVMKIVDDLRSGKKDHEDFWIRFRGKFALIRYYAVRGENGEFLGTLEVTQDIQDIQNLQGEKRLADQ